MVVIKVLYQKQDSTVSFASAVTDTRWKSGSVKEFQTCLFLRNYHETWGTRKNKKRMKKESTEGKSSECFYKNKKQK